MIWDEGSFDIGGPSPIGEIRAIDSILALISSGGREVSLKIRVSRLEITVYDSRCKSFHRHA
jgi:hypothetical protein